MQQICGLKYRFYPTPDQASLLVRTFGCERFVVNRMVEERSRRWREEKKGMSYAEMSALLTEWKKAPDLAWLNDVSSVALQQKLRHLESGYNSFFKWCRTKSGPKVGYPQFMSRRDQQSASFASSAFTWDGKDLRIAKSKEPLKIVWTQVFWGDPSMVTISMEPDGSFWVSFSVEVETDTYEVGRDAIGLDAGLTHYVTDDLGNKVDAPKPLRKALSKLAREQRRHSRKVKGGKNKEKSRRKVAKVHAKVRRIRLDFIHKLSSKLVAENQVICIETLKIAGMLRNRRLAKAISDAAWGEFFRQLQYKAAWHGREVVRISQWEPSSKKCSSCGHRLKELGLKIRAWTCPACGVAHDRDVNAAINIRVAGLAILAERSNACGADVRRFVRKEDARSAKSGAEWLRKKQEGPTGIRSERKLAA